MQRSFRRLLSPRCRRAAAAVQPPPSPIISACAATLQQTDSTHACHPTRTPSDTGQLHLVVCSLTTVDHRRDDGRLRLPLICQSVLKIQTVSSHHHFRLEARAQSRIYLRTTSSQRIFPQRTLLHRMFSMARPPSSLGPGGPSSNLKPFHSTTSPLPHKSGSVGTDPVHRWANGDITLHTAVLQYRGTHR